MFPCYFLPTDPLRALPGRKAGVLLAAISILAFVWGLIPVRALRLRTSKVPKPTSCTFWPFFKAPVIAPRVASTAADASFLDSLAFFATSPASSFLVKYYTPFLNKSLTLSRLQQIPLSSCKISWNMPVSYTHLRAHETRHDLVCRLLLEKKKKKKKNRKKK